MKANKILFTLIASTLTLSSLTACGGKSSVSPYLPPNTQPGGFNPNPNDPNFNNGNGINSPISSLGSLIGRVVDSTGKGLANVTISVRNVSTTSSITGDYQLNNVPAGQQSVLLRYGNRQLSINANVTADTVISPDVNPVQFSNNGTGNSGTANVQMGTFKTDQDFLNQWQAKGIAASGGSVYVTVADNTSLSKKGSIVRMDTDSGKNWKNIGSTWLGLRYPLDKTIQGIAISGTNLVAVDSKGSLYTIENKKKIKSFKTGAGTDVAVGAGNVFIVNGSVVEKADSSGQGRSAIANLTVTGGIGADTIGNLYAISGSGIKKVDTQMNVTDIITQGVSNGIDVAFDDKNGLIYVLENTEIKRFSIQGLMLASFGNGAVKANGIATDELGNVYVSDEGKDYKTSKIIKFGPGDGGLVNYQNQDMIKATSATELNFDGLGDGSPDTGF